MMRWVFTAGCMTLLAIGSANGQSREEKVRNDKQKVEAEGYWIYNDLPKAFAEAEKTGKPMVVVLRCLPCVECVKLDDELIDADTRVRPLLDKFVRVRVVSTNGLDLSLFQFDTDQSFAVFLLNADKTIYGRFGTRSHRTNWIGDVSIEGMAKALQGALDLHADYPANKESLAAKRGPAPEFARPELFPSLKDKYQSTLNYQGNVVKSCIHCHQIGDAVRELVRDRGEKMPETVLFPYPHPKTIGLVLDPKEKATVLSVEPGSVADKAGLKAGDAIQSLNGQPLLSIADVQWVLHRASPEGAELKAEVKRGNDEITKTISLPKNWRRQDDIAWRASTWGLRQAALGGMFLAARPESEDDSDTSSSETKVLKVQHVGQYAPHDIAHRAGIRKGDQLVSFDGRTDFTRETDIIAYSLWERNPGDDIKVTVRRDGKQRTFTLKLPR